MTLFLTPTQQLDHRFFKGPINDGEGLDIFFRTFGTNSLIEVLSNSTGPVADVKLLFLHSLHPIAPLGPL